MSHQSHDYPERVLLRNRREGLSVVDALFQSEPLTGGLLEPEFQLVGNFDIYLSILACTDQCCGLSPVDRHIDMHELDFYHSGLKKDPNVPSSG